MARGEGGSRRRKRLPDRRLRACCVGAAQRVLREKRRRQGNLRGWTPQKGLQAPKNPHFRREIFETLVVIGFALRYHSKRRPGKRQHGRCGIRHTLAAATRKRRGAPGPSLLDGAARVRIIGAFALFVST